MLAEREATIIDSHLAWTDLQNHNYISSPYWHPGQLNHSLRNIHAFWCLAEGLNNRVQVEGESFRMRVHSCGFSDSQLIPLITKRMYMCTSAPVGQNDTERVLARRYLAAWDGSLSTMSVV